MSISRFICLLAVSVTMMMALDSCGTSKSVSSRTPVSQKKTEKPKVAKKSSASHGRKAGGDMVSALVDEARDWIGTPYLYGGKSRDGADCSGFVMQIFHDAAGVDIPRTSRDQDVYCEDLERDELEAGDLIFFSSKKSEGKIAHVGMYIGGGKMIHSSSSRGVIESSINQTYYADHYVKAGRIPSIARLSPPKRRKRPGPTEDDGDHEPVVCPDPEPFIEDMALTSTITTISNQIAPVSKPVDLPAVVTERPEVAPVEHEDEEPVVITDTPDPESVVKNAFSASRH